MKENRISIRIELPVSRVFDFTTNPENTPKWIGSIVEEKTNEWPVRVGTIYRNRNKDGMWTEYELVEFERNKSFTMKQRDGDYSVRYIFTDLGNGSTELTYFEWVEKGDLKDPFTEITLKNLKSVMED